MMRAMFADPDRIKSLRAAAAPIVALTGAGISQESGLRTFRDADGVWAKTRIEDVATPEAFARDPNRVHNFYNARRRRLLDPRVRPNAAHAALARLERRWPGETLIVTQNVDDLHERAGSRALIHMHGELLKSRCAHCGAVAPCRDDLATGQTCTACGRPGAMRPHVVWFGETPLRMDDIGRALARCGVFLSIGASGQVYPAAGFVQATPAACWTVALNLAPPAGASLFDICREGPAGELVPAFVATLCDGGA